MTKHTSATVKSGGVWYVYYRADGDGRRPETLHGVGE